MPDDTDLPLACQDHDIIVTAASRGQRHPTLHVWNDWCTKTDEGGIDCIEYRYVGSHPSVTAKYAERETRRLVTAVLNEVQEQLHLKWQILGFIPGDTATSFGIYLRAVPAK